MTQPLATAATRTTTARRLMPYLLVFVAFVSIYLITAAGRMWNTDGWTRYLVAVGLVDTGSPALPTNQLPGSYWIVYGTDNKPYSYYGLGQSLAFVPLYAAGKLMSQVMGTTLTDWPSFFASFLNSIVAALLAVAVFGASLEMGYSKRTALGIAALGGLGTIIWAHARDNYDHLLETLCLAAAMAILLAAVNRRSKWLFVIAGLVYGFGVMTRVSILFAAPGIGLLLLFGTSRPQIKRIQIRPALLFGLGVLPGLLVNLGYGVLRFGGPFSTGYETKAPFWFGTPVWLGAANFLLSPGRGLLWYVPLTLALPFLANRFYKRSPGVALSFGAIGLSYLLLYSQFSGLGLWGWGPFYLLPLMPLIAIVWGEALAGWQSFSRLGRGLLATLIVLSVAIQALSVSASWMRTYIRATVAQAEFSYQIDWQPQWSILLNQPANVANGIERMLGGTPLEFMTTPQNLSYQLQHDVGLNTLDWWWVLAAYRGLGVALLVPLLLLVVTIISIRGIVITDRVKS